MRCKECKIKFEAKYFNQKYCMENDDCIKAFRISVQVASTKKENKDWKEKKKKLKEKVKTKSDYLKELQVVFNTYIRARDQNKGCISCGVTFQTKYDAGHYKSVGGSPELRFNELNVHGQCVYCNQHLHGNIVEYRKRLIKRIGLEEVYNLETNHEAKHYSIPELIEMKVIYKTKIKELKQIR